jgi:hypothetical protein
VAVRRWLRDTVPLRPVVLPWLVARVVALAGLMYAEQPADVHIGRLIMLDGQWYRLIALDWYDRPYHPGLWSEYPFFPLFPGMAGALMRAGLPATAALAGISWLAALAALAGTYRLARRHLPARAAPWAPWFVAVAPGALTMVLGYADSLYLAGLVWALVLVDERRWVLGGLVAAVATAARPNGWIALVAVVVAVLLARAGRKALVAVAVPSVVVLVAWSSYLWWATGDPLVFLSSKGAWDEITLGAFLRDPFTARHQPVVFHLAWSGALVVLYAARARRQPPTWAVVVALTVLPPLVLGLEGLARYAILAFPMPLAAADVLAGRRAWPAVVALGVSGVGLLAMAHLMVTRTWLP